jgi:hypothetical protein
MFEKKRFENPDDRLEFKDKGAVEIYNFRGGNLVVGRAVLKPGWHWKTDVKDFTAGGSELCESEHTGYLFKGTLVGKMKDGKEYRFSAGDLFYLPAGHDAWVEGEVAVELVDFTGMKHYAEKAKAEKKVA